MADEDTVKIQSNDGKVFEILVGVARLSATLKALIEGWFNKNNTVNTVNTVNRLWCGRHDPFAQR